MNKAAIARIKKKQQKAANDVQRKNAGVKGDEMKNMLNMQKNLRKDIG